QVSSGADGAFELFGLAEGSATVRASMQALESEARAVTISADTEPITLVVRALRAVEGIVVLSSGLPVAGAMIRDRTSGMPLTGDFQSSSTGRFTLHLPDGAATLSLVVVAPGLPAKMATVPIASAIPIQLVMGQAAGDLVLKVGDVPPYPTVTHDGVTAPLPLLWMPSYAGGPREVFTAEGIVLSVEPGAYLVCQNDGRSQRCRSVVVPAGGTATIDLTTTEDTASR
ncbi:MAG: hypothetical protein JWN02_1953, partial [Acidobacteria bacterium]|nr:hypothetical protein [Acidobacteriota bacterium]